MKTAVDAHDLRLLALLQEDATLSIAELAERIHLSSNACWKRLKRLEAEGVIRKRVALLDAGKLAAGVTVFATVRAVDTRTRGSRSSRRPSRSCRRSWSSTG